MKELFPGFYKMSNEEVQDLWNQSHFVFDTNVLLNVFRYPAKPRELLFLFLQHLREKIWEPHQIVMEYHFNLMREIATQNTAYDDLIKVLNQKFLAMEEDFKKYAQRHSNLKMDPDLLKEIKISLEKVVQDLHEQKLNHPDLHSLQMDMAEVIGNKVGVPYTQNELDEIYREGERRFDVKIPPGFKDTNKGEELRFHDGVEYQNKYGDLVLWMQVLQHAKDQEDVKSVILVTDDSKGDWWVNNKGERRPDPELIQEFKRVTNGKKIHIYNTKQFFRNGTKYLNIDISDSELDEVIKSIDDYKKNKEHLVENKFVIKKPIKILSEKEENYMKFKISIELNGDERHEVFEQIKENIQHIFEEEEEVVIRRVSNRKKSPELLYINIYISTKSKNSHISVSLLKELIEIQEEGENFNYLVMDIIKLDKLFSI